MTNVYKIQMTEVELMSPGHQPHSLPPEKCLDRMKQSTKDKDESEHKHENQISSSEGKQEEKSFSEKLKDVKEHIKGMKWYRRFHHATSSIDPWDLKEHMQKLGSHLKPGSGVDYTLLEEPDSQYQEECREFLPIYKHKHGTESPTDLTRLPWL